MDELHLIVQSVCLGAALCCLYDLIRILRRLFPRGTVFTGLEDLLWWAIAAVAVFALVYHENGGIVRAYIVVFVLSGMCLWELAAGRWLVKYISRILNLVLDFFLNKIMKNCYKLLKKIIKPFTILFTEKFGKRGADIEKPERQQKEQ